MNICTLRTAVVGGACLVALCAVAGPASAAGGHNIMTKNTVRAADSGASAVTYDPAVVPTGAEMSVGISDAGDGSTTVTLAAQGLLPNRGYAAHAHVNPCGETGADAGPHFQNNVDPAATADAPSTDPAYANARNEVWLDLHTDGRGNGKATTEVPFAFGTRAPHSVVIHDAEATATDAGHAGMAGSRAACVTLPG